MKGGEEIWNGRQARTKKCEKKAEEDGRIWMKEDKRQVVGRGKQQSNMSREQEWSIRGCGKDETKGRVEKKRW